MVRVVAFSLSGKELFFNTSDHSPPHFHVLKPGEWEIRVDIDQSSKVNGLVYTFKFRNRRKKMLCCLLAKEEKEILEHVIADRLKLLKQWQEQVCTREII